MNVTTVGELLDYLANQPRDRRIILAKDAEGNAHSPLASAAEALYEPETTWSGWAYSDDDEDAPDDAERVIVLDPTN